MTILIKLTKSSAPAVELDVCKRRLQRLQDENPNLGLDRDTRWLIKFNAALVEQLEAAHALLDKIEYSYDGYIKRYPEYKEVNDFLNPP